MATRPQGTCSDPTVTDTTFTATEYFNTLFIDIVVTPLGIDPATETANLPTRVRYSKIHDL